MSTPTEANAKQKVESDEKEEDGEAEWSKVKAKTKDETKSFSSTSMETSLSFSIVWLCSRTLLGAMLIPLARFTRSEFIFHFFFLVHRRSRH